MEHWGDSLDDKIWHICIANTVIENFSAWNKPLFGHGSHNRETLNYNTDLQNNCLASTIRPAKLFHVIQLFGVVLVLNIDCCTFLKLI